MFVSAPRSGHRAALMALLLATWAKAQAEGPNGIASVAPLDLSAARPRASERAILDAGATAASWQVEDARFRFSVFSQDGRGYQSRTGRVQGPGSERALIFQPIAAVSIRQNRDVTHEIVVPIDIVSSASANAIDVVSSASAVNESVALEITNHFQLSTQDAFHTLLGYHHEEPLASGAFGLGYRRSLAHDNAGLAISAQGTIDRFKNIEITGQKLGERNRTTLNANLGFTQLLSETTVLELGYGLTFQSGTLETTYFTVPLSDRRTRIAERFPDTRTRHAARLALAQHVIPSQSTLRLDYRYYQDDFGVVAHTAQFQLYQYLSESVAVGPAYRFYTQTSADFFAESFSVTSPVRAPRTSDSDLAPFQAHRYGLKLLMLAGEEQNWDVSYFYYARSNDFAAHMLSFGYWASF